MINTVTLVGRLTRDVDFKQTQTSSVANFTVAIDTFQKDENGNTVSSFIPCVTFSNNAEVMAKYCRKGHLIGLEGRLNQRSYTKQDGTKVNVIEVIAVTVKMLETKASAKEIDSKNGSSLQTAPDMNQQKNCTNMVEEDDLPW